MTARVAAALAAGLATGTGQWLVISNTRIAVGAVRVINAKNKDHACPA